MNEARDILMRLDKIEGHLKDIHSIASKWDLERHVFNEKIQSYYKLQNGDIPISDKHKFIFRNLFRWNKKKPQNQKTLDNK